MAGLVSIIPLPQRTWLAFQFQTDRCGLEAGRGDSAWQEQNRTNGKTTGPSERFPTTKQHCELEPSAGTPESCGELGSAPSTQGPPLGAGCWAGTGHRISSAPPLLLLATGQALEALALSGALTLVLEEDGTTVESEDFFQLLEDDTCLMVLELGQRWSPRRVRGPYWGCSRPLIPSVSPKPLVSPSPDLEGRGNERGEELSDSS